MHARIFQVSQYPIDRSEYVKPQDFYDNDFADYIGDEQEGVSRKEDIQRLQEVLSDLFDLDAEHEALVYKGSSDFIKKWVQQLHQAAAKITEESILQYDGTFRLEMILKETHVKSSHRFVITGWSSLAERMSDFVCYVTAHLNEGDRLYVGAVIDYHC